jgi:hypothetical protein
MPSHHHFTAPLPQGNLGLVLPSPSACSAPTLDAGTALGQAEPWLCELEQSLGCAIVPTLTAADQVFQPPQVVLDNTRLSSQIHLPWAVASQTHSALTSLLPDWAWRQVQGELILGALTLDPRDQAHIQPGALVLIAASFEEHWWVQLQLPHLATTLDARLQRHKGQLALHITPDTSTLQNQPDTIRCTTPVWADPLHFLAAATCEPSRLPDTSGLLGPHSVALHTRMADGQPRRAVGQLIPIGMGFGLRVDALT